MKFYRFALLKTYFDTGFGLTSYVKLLIALYGLSSLNTITTLIIAGVYGVCCFFIGWAWFHYGFASATFEVQNRFDPFAKEVRAKLK